MAGLKDISEWAATTVSNLGTAITASVKGFNLSDPVQSWLSDSGNSINGEHVRNPFKNSVYTYTSISGIARAMTSIGLLLRNKKTKKIVDDDDNLSLRVLKQPNALENSDAFFERTVILRYRDGEAFWVRPDETASSTPAIFVARQTEMRKIESGGMLIGWFWTKSGTGTPRRLRLDQVRRLYFVDPDDELGSFAPIDASQLSIDQHVFASRFNTHVFLNMADVGATYYTEKYVNPQQRKQIEDEIKTRFAGYWNAKRPFVMWGGLRKEQTTQSMKDLEYQKGKEQARDEILAPLFTPPIFAGIYDHATLNNSKEQKTLFWDMAALPEIRTVLENWNSFVQARLDPTLEVVYDSMSIEALKEREIETTDAILALQDRNVPLNTLIDTYGLRIPKQPHGDTVLVSPGLTPIEVVIADGESGQAADNQPEGDDKESPTFDQAVKSLIDAVEKSEEEKAQSRIHERWVASWQKNRRECRAQVKRFLERQAKETIARLKKTPLPKSGKAVKSEVTEWLKRVLLDLTIEDKKASLMARFEFKRAAELGGKQAMAEVESEESFLIDAPEMKKHLKQQVIRVRDINKTTQKLLKRILTQGLDQGATINQMSEAIAEAMGHRANKQSYRIANTEIHEAVSAGRHEGYRQSGIKHKRWLTSGRGVAPGGPVRQSHYLAEAQTKETPIPLDKKFKLISKDGSVSHCNHPGEGTLPPGERIFCSCMELSAKKRDGKELSLSDYERIEFLSS